MLQFLFEMVEKGDKAQDKWKDKSLWLRAGRAKSRQGQVPRTCSQNDQGCLGGSVVERLLSAQGMIPNSWD